MGHTPGPWKVHPWGDSDYEINAAASTVCNVPGFDDDTVDADKTEANANLIAAAPELLSCCQRLLEIVEAEYEADPEPEDLDTWRAAIQLAVDCIAKAEGRE